MSGDSAQSAAVTWRLPSGYTPSQLVYAVRHAHIYTNDLYVSPAWPHDTMTAEQYVRWFRGRLNAKINRGLPARGKKCASDGYMSDYERHAMQIAQRVNTPRLIVREREVGDVKLRARLAHRMHKPEDE